MLLRSLFRRSNYIWACSLIILGSFAENNFSIADTFSSGSTQFDIEFVEIGQPDNAPDTSGDPIPAGSVGYSFRMATYTVSQEMINKANIAGGLGITHTNRIGDNRPATNLSWVEAAKFVNWLNVVTSNTPAYKFDSMGNIQNWQPADLGYDPDNLYRNTLAKYFLPSIDEWYKAAYYDPVNEIYYDYATGSDLVPVPVVSGNAQDTAVYYQTFAQGPADIDLAGGLSPYGTMGQSGNVWEWNETARNSVNLIPDDDRSLRGGNWNGRPFTISSSDPGDDEIFADDDRYGLRVASVAIIPEPTALTLVFLVSITLLVTIRH